MSREEKIVFLRDPNRVIEQLIKNFVRTTESNRRIHTDGGHYFDEPLVGFASGRDPLFFEYKKIIGPFHYTPREVVALELRKRGKPLLLSADEQISVISWILPVHEDIRRSNRAERLYASKMWVHLRRFGEQCNHELRRHVIKYLEDMGHIAIAPALQPSFESFRDERVGWTSPWSERHVAYVCGLGTFGLTDALITPKGSAVRIGSVVTILVLRPTERRYSHPKQNCLFFRGERCTACISRCPARAITEKGHDKDRCRQYCYSDAAKSIQAAYGLPDFVPACGLCLTGVPCEGQIPSPDLIA